MPSSMAPLWRPSRSNLSSFQQSASSLSGGNCTTATVILKSSNNTLSSQKAAHPYRAPHKAEQPYYRRHWPAPFSKSSSSLVFVIWLTVLPITIFLASLLFVLSSKDLPTNATHKTSHLIHGPAKTRAKPDGKVERLSRGLFPLVYSLHLQVFLPFHEGIDFGLKNFSAEGHLRLLFHCSKPNMRVLKLHMRNITVHTETINIQTQTKNVILPQFESLNYTLLTNVLALSFRQAFEVDTNYTLYLDYTALVNAPEVGGLFRTGYKDKAGGRRVMLATQMQALEARRLLPCFDQPDFKAHFELEIKHPKGTNTVSNADLLESFDQGNWTSSRFKPTPKMSTYLLALAVSEFSYKQTVYKGKKIRVWIQPAMLQHVDYALSATVKILQFFENYFGIPYPMEKLDVFGLPELRVQAMENWGLIFCRQQFLLYAQGVYSVHNRRMVTDTLAQWSDLWLNEGFAVITSAKAADYIENSTSRQDELFFEETIKALQFDQRPHAVQPLSHPVNTFSAVDQKFSFATYWKASAILRMVEGTVGAQVFRTGLSNFLNKFTYGSARAEDLLIALNQAVARNDLHQRHRIWSNLTIKEFLDPVSSSLNEPLVNNTANNSLSKSIRSWIHQPGFPLIEFTRKDSSQQVVARQYPFTTLPPPTSAKTNHSSGKVTEQNKNQFRRWNLPLFMARTSKSPEIVWLSEENTTMNLEVGEILDPEVRGYYRLCYDPLSYEAIIQKMLSYHLTIPLASRFRLLEDAFTLAKTGHVPYRVAFGLSEYLVHETNNFPFNVFTKHMNELHFLLKNFIDATPLENFVVEMLKPLYHRIFAENVVVNDIIATQQEYAMVQLCHWNYSPCLQKAVDGFAKLKQSCKHSKLSDTNCNKIAPGLREGVYGTAIRMGTTQDFMFLFNKYFLETYETERFRILCGLVSTSNISLVDYVFNRFTGQDNRDFVTNLLRSPIFYQIASYIPKKFKEIAKRLPDLQSVRLLSACVTKCVISDSDIVDVEVFIREHTKELQIHNQSVPIFVNRLRIDLGMKLQFVEKYSDVIMSYFASRRTTNT